MGEIYENEIVKRITSDLEKTQEMAQAVVHYIMLDGLFNDKEYMGKVTMLAAEYLCEIDRLKKELVTQRNEINRLYKVNEEIRRMYSVPYKEVLKKKAENGMLPAKKRVSAVDIENLEKIGLSQKEICEKLDISRSTLWRIKKSGENESIQKTGTVVTEAGARVAGSMGVDVTKRLNL